MSFPADLFSLLTGGSPNPIAAIIGDRAYAVLLKQDSEMPALAYQIIDGGEDITTDGPSGLAGFRVQLSFYSPDYLTVSNLLHTTQLFLNGYQGGNFDGIFLAGVGPDQYDHAVKLYRRTADFWVWYRG